MVLKIKDILNGNIIEIDENEIIAYGMMNMDPEPSHRNFTITPLAYKYLKEEDKKLYKPLNFKAYDEYEKERRHNLLSSSKDLRGYWRPSFDMKKINQVFGSFGKFYEVAQPPKIPMLYTVLQED